MEATNTDIPSTAPAAPAATTTTTVTDTSTMTPEKNSSSSTISVEESVPLKSVVEPATPETQIGGEKSEVVESAEINEKNDSSVGDKVKTSTETTTTTTTTATPPTEKRLAAQVGTRGPPPRRRHAVRGKKSDADAAVPAISTPAAPTADISVLQQQLNRANALLDLIAAEIDAGAHMNPIMCLERLRAHLARRPAARPFQRKGRRMNNTSSGGVGGGLQNNNYTNPNHSFLPRHFAPSQGPMAALFRGASSGASTGSPTAPPTASSPSESDHPLAVNLRAQLRVAETPEALRPLIASAETHKMFDLAAQAKKKLMKMVATTEASEK